jgi:hypothetical protein
MGDFSSTRLRVQRRTASAVARAAGAALHERVAAPAAALGAVARALPAGIVDGHP